MLRVADYGAVGDGKTDDGPSLRAALAEAAKLSMTDPDTTHVVAFEPNKVYYVDQWHELRVNALRGLSVCQGLIVFPVENVVLRNNVFHVGSDVESAMQAAVLSRCGTVTVENNKFYDERGRVEKGVLQIADTPSNAVTLKDNEFHTQPGVRHVHREEPAK